MGKFKFALFSTALFACSARTSTGTPPPVASEGRLGNQQVEVQVAGATLTSIQPVNLHVEFPAGRSPEVSVEAAADPGVSVFALSDLESLERHEWESPVLEKIRRPGATLSVGEQLEPSGRLSFKLLEKNHIAISLLDSSTQMALTGPLAISCWVPGDAPTPSDPNTAAPPTLDGNFASAECENLKYALGL